MASFKKTQTRAYTRRPTTADTLYWRKLEFPVTVKEFTAIDFVDICPSEPHHIAVTSGPKVDVYHRETTQIIRTVSRFQRLAYGAKFRSDGQLLLAGSEEGQVKLFKQKQLLRIFKGHAGPTHRVDFVRGLPQITTFSDDKTAVVWDLTDESQICTLTGHTDFIRAGLASPASAHLVLTGGYDHTVRLWDTRTGTSVSTLNHGAPVESLVCFPNGGVIVSAGGTEVRVWDTIAGRLLSKLSQHHKTVTCLDLASEGRRLLSGSLDRRVKVYDVSTYSVVHTLDYPAPVLSLAVAPGDSTLAVGMISGGSGLLSFQHRRVKDVSAVQQSSKARHRAADFRHTVAEDFRTLANDTIVPYKVGRQKASRYDAQLQKFQYSKALDQVMKITVKPNITVGVLQELIRRGGIKTAVAGRNIKELRPLFNFILKYLRYPAYKQVLMDVATIVIDVYEDSLDEIPGLVPTFTKLKDEIAVEIASSQEYISLMGAIQMFLTVSKSGVGAPDPSVEQLATTSTLCQSDVNSALHPSVSASSHSAVLVDVS